MGVVLQPGSIIAQRYRLERMLGSGGMGAVWAATHEVTRRRVAMKFMRGPAHTRAELRDRFMREARAATAVKHPNVVHVIDVFELDEETPVMVMELLEGETLADRIEKAESLPLDETARLLLPVVAAVGTAHARGVVHRDLKPENVFIALEKDNQETVKVLDFGIAKLTDLEGAEAGGLVTRTGATLGTPCYMAPEQAVAKKDLDHRVDVWALGVILYECLSGVRPIEGESVGQVVMRLMSTGITPLEHLVSGLPDDVTDLVARMLSRERSRRPDHLGEVAEVLEQYSKEKLLPFGAPGSEIEAATEHENDSEDRVVLGVAMTDGRGSTMEAPRSRRSRAALVVGASAVALGIGVGAWAIAAAPSTATRQLAPEISATAPTPVASPRPTRRTRSARHALPSPSAAPPVSAPAIRRLARRPPVRHAPVRKPAASARPPKPASASPPTLKGLAETPPF